MFRKRRNSVLKLLTLTLVAQSSGNHIERVQTQGHDESAEIGTKEGHHQRHLQEPAVGSQPVLSVCEAQDLRGAAGHAARDLRADTAEHA